MRSGAWFRYGDLQLGQGREKAREYLKENPALLEELKTKIIAARGYGGAPLKTATASGEDFEAVVESVQGPGAGENMARTTRYFCCLLLGLAALGVGTAGAQEPAGIEAATAMEKVLVDAIACGEKSVVAIARVRKDEPPGETFRFEVAARPLRPPLRCAPAPQPTDPSFVPSEYGSGVVVDRRGLILTAYHVLGEDSEYYVTTPERKVYRGAGDRGRSAQRSGGLVDRRRRALTPIALGDATTLRKGQFVITLGNPYAIARDGQASAGWGIVANLARKAPPSPEDSETLGQQTLHHLAP